MASKAPTATASRYDCVALIDGGAQLEGQVEKHAHYHWETIGSVSDRARGDAQYCLNKPPDNEPPPISWTGK